MVTTVKQLLNMKTESLHMVAPDDLVIDAIRILDQEKIGALIVVEDAKLRGIFSERDYTRKVVLKNRSSSNTRIGQIMTAQVVTVVPEQTVKACMIMMADNHVRHLPVLENDRPIGLISIMDVLQSMISEKNFIIEQLEHYITDSL